MSGIDVMPCIKINHNVAYTLYSKTCVKQSLRKTKNWYHLMQVKSIAEYSKGSILQYFRPSLSYHLSLRSLFCLFLSGRFTEVLLYVVKSSALLAKNEI